MYSNEESNIKTIVLFDAFHASISKMIVNPLKIVYLLADLFEKLRI
jgi:hypothetical protein